jgi:CheY-like chemotaxis protein
VGLLDLRMPGMDGLTLCRRLKQLWPGMFTLIVTAHPAQAAGARQVLLKPVDVARLFAVVEQAAPLPK